MHLNRNVTIHLPGPICKCELEEGENVGKLLNWSITGNQLTIECSRCSASLVIPKGKIGACLSLDVPYPVKKEEKPKTKLTALDGGKLIDMFGKKDDTKGGPDAA